MANFPNQERMPILTYYYHKRFYQEVLLKQEGNSLANGFQIKGEPQPGR